MMIKARRFGESRSAPKLELSVSQIHYMTPAVDGAAAGTITDLQGGEWIADAADILNLANPIIHTMPVEKGTFIVFAQQDDPSRPWEIIGQNPVLGWLVRQDGDIHPANIAGLEDYDDSSWAIKHPNGEIEVPHSAYFGDEKIWLEDLNKRYFKPKRASK